MAGIFRHFLEHLSPDQLLELLYRYLATPESNRDSEFYLSLKSVVITLKEQDKLLDDLVCRVTRELCLPVVRRCGDSHENRHEIHIVYEITALCCAFGPRNLVQEVASLCLEGLSNRSKEITTQTGLPVVVCVDFISYLMKDDVKHVVGEDLRKEMFEKLLVVLYDSDELMCMKITSSVLPLFLSLDTAEGQERILIVWRMIKEMSVDKHNGDGVIKSCYPIMCSLADFFITDSNSNNNILWDSRFWELLQEGLYIQDPLSSKRSMYLLKRALDLVDKQKLNMEVKGDCDAVIFYWNTQQRKYLMEIWEEFVLLMETLNETQVHVIKPVLPRISKIITASEKKQDGSLALHITWLTTVVIKASLHPSRYIRKWAVMEILTMDLAKSPLLVPTNWSFLLGHFQAMLNEYAIYGPDDETGKASPIGTALVSFYNSCLSSLPKEQHVDFLANLLTAIKNQKFTSVPMVFISQSLSCIDNTCVLGSDALQKMRNILVQLRTHPTQMRIPTKEFILSSAANLTDPNLLDWDVIFHFLATGNLEECLTRGSWLWNGLCEWLWKIESEKQNVDNKGNSSNGNHLCEGVFHFLGKKVESFLNNPDMLDDSINDDTEALGRLIIAAVDTLHSKKCRQDHHNSSFISLLNNMTQIFHDASTRLYMSETKLSKATKLLSTILRVLNFSADNYTRSHNHAIILLRRSLKKSLSDILNFMQRKLTTSDDELSSGKTYLDLCNSLHCFFSDSDSDFAENSSLKSSLTEFYKFVEGVAVISAKTIQRFQTSQNYELKELVHFQQSVLFVAWCCEISKCKEDLSASASEQILHAIPSFQLNMEFKKLDMVKSVKNEDSTASNAAKGSSSWGSVVSEIMSALWTISAFFLQHNVVHKAETSETVVITSPIKDVLGAAIDALDSTFNVLPIIKTIGLLIPNLLQTDVDSCSRSLDVVWKTLRDMWSNTTFWEDLPVFLDVFFSPVLLMLPEDHPLTKKIKWYLETLLNEGESRPGVMHAVILQLSSVWVSELKAECHKSLQVHLDIVIQMLLFGPMVGKANRIESHVESYLRHLGNQSSLRAQSLDMRDDSQVRVTMINVLLALDSSNTYNQDLFKRIIRSLIVWDQEINTTQTTIYINSLYHRKKHRAWQTILVLLPLAMKRDTEGYFTREILENVFTSMQDQNQVSVQNFQQWIVLNILTRNPDLTTLLWDELLYHQDKKVGRMALLVTIAMLYAVHCVPTGQGERDLVFNSAITAVFPWVTASHRNVRVIAQVAVQRMWYCCISENLLWVLKENSIIVPCLTLIKGANDTLAEKIRLLESYFVFDFHPIRDLSMETIFYTIPKHSGITQEEWVEPKDFQRSVLGKTVWCEPDEFQQSPFVDSIWSCLQRIPLYNKDRRLANFQTMPYNNKEKFGVHLERRIREERKPSLKVVETEIKPAGQESDNAVLNVQKKMIAWKIVPPEEVMMADLQQQRMLALQKSSGGNLVVVASLIDKAPNLGGLCRTSEIFGVRKLVLGSTDIMKDHNFKTLSVSSAKWIDIEQVRPAELKGYLRDMRHQGYKLIGVEQTANSQPLTQYQFPHNALLLLGNEKEGIPADLIQLLDECVEIPQVGIIRSLNVHVSGALLIWEYTRQRLLTAHSTAE